MNSIRALPVGALVAAISGCLSHAPADAGGIRGELRVPGATTPSALSF